MMKNDLYIYRYFYFYKQLNNRIKNEDNRRLGIISILIVNDDHHANRFTKILYIESMKKILIFINF